MSSPETRTEVACPVCKAKVIWDDSSPWRPFCSERCRMIDLGDWLAENHCISEPVDEYQVPEPDEQ